MEPRHVTKTTDWDALRQIRLAGQKPTLPVIVTSIPHLPKRLEGVGCLVILHQSGEVMPVKLLEGLDVIWFFDRCHVAQFTWKLCQDKGVKLARSRVWCACAELLSALPMWCDSHADMVRWAEEKASA
jgi:hypothetical protein